MQILVWKAHGDILVYDITTNEQLVKVIHTMIECLDGWGLEAEIEQAESYLRDPTDRRAILRVFNMLRDAVGTDHDMFEDIFIADLQ